MKEKTLVVALFILFTGISVVVFLIGVIQMTRDNLRKLNNRKI